MSINFPNSPTSGSTYTFDGKSWVYNGQAWEIIDATDLTAFATTGSNTFTGNQIINANVDISGTLDVAGLTYPTTDGLEFQVITTDGAGTLTFDDVHTIYEEVYTGEAVTKGDPLYISGSEGAKPVVYLADAADSAKMPVTFIAAETIGAANDTRGIVLGLIGGLDLTGLNAGDVVYVAEGGGWSTSKPSGSSSITQLLGVVTKGDTGGKGLVLNPGPATLPTIQEGYLWVGDENNRAEQVTTSSLAVASSVSASYALSASYAVTSSTADDVQVLTSASYAAITPVSGTIYIVTE